VRACVRVCVCVCVCVCVQGAENVLRRIHADLHVEPNVTTYNLVINAYANRGHWKVRAGVGVPVAPRRLLLLKSLEVLV
jgi:hypothetical protein